MSAQLSATRFGIRTLLASIAGWAAALSFVKAPETALPTGCVLFVVYALAVATFGAIWAVGRWANLCAGFALCAGAYFVLLPPQPDIIIAYLPRFEFSGLVQEQIVYWWPKPKSKMQAAASLAVADPNELFPRDLEIDPISIGIKVFGLGYPMFCPPGGSSSSCGCFFNVADPPPPPAVAIQHCVSTLFVGVCGALTVCWLRKPQEQS